MSRRPGSMPMSLSSESNSIGGFLALRSRPSSFRMEEPLQELEFCELGAVKRIEQLTPSVET